VTWSALGDDAVERLRIVLRELSVLAQPAPRSSRRFVVATTADGIVPPSSMEAIARHWRVEPTRIDSGPPRRVRACIVVSSSEVMSKMLW
jgi:hypothetical protein